MVIKPPGRPKLHLSRYFAGKSTRHCRNHIVYGSVEAIENHLRQGFFTVDIIQHSGKALGRNRIADNIDTAVSTGTAEEAGVYIAQRRHMQLHGPAASGVTYSEETGHKICIEVKRRSINLFPLQNACKGMFCVFISSFFRGNVS